MPGLVPGISILSMIRQSGYRFAEKIMRHKRTLHLAWRNGRDKAGHDAGVD
jgi:hypothetical protein